MTDYSYILFVFTLSIVTASQAPELSIYDIQYTVDPAGSSPYANQVVDCAGGIVTHKFPGFRPKFTLQMPDSIEGDYFRAIQVKDWLSGAPVFNAVKIGDRVSLQSFYVEEFRGNTILQAWGQYSPQVTVLSSNNLLPDIIDVTVDQIPAPVPAVDGGWYVHDHSTEKYEHMRIRVWDVTVTDWNLGKASDNYALSSEIGGCWAADYMNDDAAGFYHDLVSLDVHFCSVEGILEQYTNAVTGWDYYQLLTTSTADFNTGYLTDMDNDCDVDLQDYSRFTQYWQQQCYTDPNLCGNADIIEDSTVNFLDLLEFSGDWLDGNIFD